MVHHRDVHPIGRRWKQLLRVDWTLTMLAIQILCAISLGIITHILIIALCVNSDPKMLPHNDEAIRWLSIIAYGVIGPMTGAWLTVGFSHLGFRRAWSGWIAIMLSLLLVQVCTICIAGGQMTLFDLDWQRTPLERCRQAVVRFLIPSGRILVMMMAAGIAGIPLGMILLRFFKSMRTMRWRYRRRMRKRARVA
jgi:hypothetical protein